MSTQGLAAREGDRATRRNSPLKLKGEFMSQITRSNAGDIVVVVPRWLIMVVGLVMLLMGLSISFFLLFAGFVQEGIFLSMLVLIMVPLQLLLTYIVWRYYWYFMVIGSLISGLIACTVFTGTLRIGGNTYSMIRLAPSAPAMPVGDALAVIAFVAFIAALAVSMLIGYMINMVMGLSAPAESVRKSRPRDELPLDDPRQSRKRDLWKDDK